MSLSLAYSPCPNDTFMFAAIAANRQVLPQDELEIHLHDVETLNRYALSSRYDFTKLSFHAWLLVRERYQLLEVGAALGYGCGPLVISKGGIGKAELADCRIALPGELTTAHLLFQLWAPEARNKVFVPFDEIFNLVETGQVDCGVIIHEGRFTYQQAGFQLIVDLGEWWEQQTAMPIPLGCIAAKKGLPEQTVQEFSRVLSLSLKEAQAKPQAAYPYMKEHAQELDAAVLDQHVKTYVNDFSEELGPLGWAAVNRLEKMARAAGVIA